VPTNLPKIREPNDPDRAGLEADAWAGMAVVFTLFVVGVIYWTGHTGGAQASQITGSAIGSPPAIGSDTPGTALR